jgi:hypothetical protein
MVIVDTCVWSLALRRNVLQGSSPVVIELEQLIRSYKVQMLGPVRQELLSGIRSKKQFNKLKKYLTEFPDLPLITEDHENAAEYFNFCRAKGIQGSNTDFLLCSIAKRCGFALYTTDKDFLLFSKHLPIKLHKLEHI